MIDIHPDSEDDFPPETLEGILAGVEQGRTRPGWSNRIPGLFQQRWRDSITRIDASGGHRGALIELD